MHVMQVLCGERPAGGASVVANDTVLLQQLRDGTCAARRRNKHKRRGHQWFPVDTATDAVLVRLCHHRHVDAGRPHLLLQEFALAVDQLDFELRVTLLQPGQSWRQ
ncbi:hypothetical protein D3C86_1773980 [compost metagenome]